MKKLIYLVLVIGTVFLFSCEKDEDDNDPVGVAQELTGHQETNIILEDIVDGPGADYYVTGKWSVDADVTVREGVKIRMDADSKIEILTDGSFSAVGTADKRIIIYGNEPTKGYWQEFSFEDCNDTKNKLSFVTMSDGGGGYGAGMLDIHGNSNVEVNNTILENSDKYGMYLTTGDETLPNFNNNVIANCADYPIGINTGQLHFLDASTIFSDNGDNSYVYVDDGQVDNNVTWKKLSGPVLFYSAYNSIYADVTVEPGAHFIMGSGGKIIVEPEGSLNMMGTADEHITITGKVNSPGYWEMIAYDDSNNPLNKLNYVDISYANEANLRCSGSTRIEIANSSFNHSANYGIYLGRDVTFTDGGGNTFTGNASDDIYVQPR